MATRSSSKIGTRSQTTKRRATPLPALGNVARGARSARLSSGRTAVGDPGELNAKAAASSARSDRHPGRTGNGRSGLSGESSHGGAPDETVFASVDAVEPTEPTHALRPVDVASESSDSSARSRRSVRVPSLSSDSSRLVCAAVIVAPAARLSSHPVSYDSKRPIRMRKVNYAKTTMSDVRNGSDSGVSDGVESTVGGLAADEYEVDEILDMKTTNKNGMEERSYFVSWVGYDDRTWEPEGNLPDAMVQAYRQQGAQGEVVIAIQPGARTKPIGVTGNRRSEVCATCGDGPDGLGSSCARCYKPMHHFCATDVCKALKLKDESGDDMVEFPNDACYCSKICYVTRKGAVRAGKRKRVRLANAESDSEYEDEDGVVVSKPQRKLPVSAVTASTKAKALKRKSTEINDDGVPSLWPPPKPKAALKPILKATVVAPRSRDPLVGKMVAFCADQEDWMPARLYKEAKGLYLSGRVFRPKRVIGERMADDVYEVRWTVTNYQTGQYTHKVKRPKIEEGIRNHSTISGGTLNKATWQHICRVPESEEMNIGNSLDDYVVLDGTSDVFVSQQVQPDNLELVEKIKNLDFQPSRRMQQPMDLFSHDDGSVEPKLIKEKSRHFDSASSSFFAYLPLSFWKTVVCESNEYADHKKGAVITLDELLKFFGIMFYMTVVAKGEYSNYWGDQVEGEILGVSGASLGLDSVMTLKGFQYIRKNLCFRCSVTPDDLKTDPAARIRPLINMIKYTSTKYVVLGRNVAVDESSIACRSRFGRHLIVFNASKPTGKFHFKIYACCCASSWLMYSFRLHCSSDMEHRLRGVIPTSAARYLEDRLQFSSSVRQIVLEVTQPLHGSKRIVNTENYYTSVTLLLSLRDVGMYGRGTIKEGSAHFPKAHMFAKKADEPRGSSLQGVSKTGEMVAASWMDGSAVNLISNADSSEMGTVTRLIGKNHTPFPAPACVAEYNKNMQGVDRLDQLRAKYSLADGHSMKKWHKKLALAFIDIARVNAYVTRGLREKDKKPSRNAHRDFMIELATELITGSWKETADDEGMLFADDPLSTAASSTTSSPRPSSTPPSPTTQLCEFVLASEMFPGSTRGKRGCKVCAFEGRAWTMKTNYCYQHNVCLCSNTYPMIAELTSILCPHLDWSCWRKYHDYYLPRGLFNDHGRIKRSSSLHKARRQLGMHDEEAKTSSDLQLPDYFGPHTSQPTPSPP